MTAGGGAWADAVREAQRLEAEHPGWRVSPVRRYTGIGLAADRDGDGIVAFIGPAAEVRAELEKQDAA